MDFKSVIESQFCDPAAIIIYTDGSFKTIEINDRYMPELWMNISKNDYLEADPEKLYDDVNRDIFIESIKKCIDSNVETVVETWRQLFSDCCGFDKVCLKSRFILLENTPEGAYIFEGIKNISNEKRMQTSLEDIEYRYKATSEQVNIYNWEYTVATKEMRPCYRCMRDLGLPPLVTN